MSETVKTSDEHAGPLKNAEEQISALLETLEEQDAQIWAYLIGGVVALLIGLLAAYLYAQTVREKRRGRLERVKDTLRGGLIR